MKRSWLKRKTALKAKKPWKPKRSKLRLASHSTAAQIKVDIQAWLRAIAIVRDGGCFLREARPEHTEVLQFDHLITRSNSATYADDRLGVCVCTGCHYWKKYHKEQYDELVRSLLPRDRVDLWDKAQQDSWRPTPMGAHDWNMQLVYLKDKARKMGITALT